MAINTYEAQFSISSKGALTQESYAGVFTVKTRISHMDRLKIDTIRRELLGPNPAGQEVNDDANAISIMLSTLRVRVLKAPSWWTESAHGAELADENILAEVYTAAMKAEAELTKATIKAGEDAKKTLTGLEPKDI